MPSIGIPLPPFLDSLAHAAPHSLLALALRLAFSLAIASIVALRPTRPRNSETVQAQILLAFAAAVVTTAIEDSVARAFGLVGLGGFVRFRSGIKDTREAATMFLMIAFGMASGVGLLALAATSAGIAFAVLTAMDVLGKGRLRRDRIRIVASGDVAGPMREQYGARVLHTEKQEGAMTTLLEIETRDPLDAAALFETLSRSPDVEVRSVTIEEGKAA